MPVRDAKRRGEGWLAGLSDIGWSNSLGWYEGLRLLVAINPAEVITGLGFACASTKDQPLAETFFALGVEPNDTGWQGGGIGGPGTVCERQRLPLARRTTDDGSSKATGHASSARPKATNARADGPSNCGVGQRASVRFRRPSRRSSTTPLAFAGSEPTS
jgi:hypothetical protein